MFQRPVSASRRGAAGKIEFNLERYNYLKHPVDSSPLYLYSSKKGMLDKRSCIRKTLTLLSATRLIFSIRVKACESQAYSPDSMFA
ncbi:hypothetical protein [Siccibacter turicensis]|uniref:hypothetical protein n=1 Tax=Siccibacter turicensis TaxID=357233 RepID=UPI002A6AFE3E|nr:hypothetical protein [Siccibacter turicensis]MDY0971064.1 hypothetical protein [Siccibacter turicensis]